MSRLFTAFASIALLSSAAPLMAQVPAEAAAEVQPAERSEAEQLQDASRKPAEILAYFGLKDGDVAAELLAGGGYYAKLMAPMVGPTGKVIAYNPPAFVQREASLKNWADLTAQPDNIELQIQNFSDFSAPENSFDFAMLHLAYHDVYFESAKFGITRAEPEVFLASLFAAMKPGGTMGVVDHVGMAGDTRTIVDKYHRIDPATVKADFAKAGFVLESESDMFANPDDDHSKNVFDKDIRGETDRFVFKFKKPG